MAKWLLLLSLCAGPVQDMFDRTTYERWAGFKPGSFVRFRVSTSIEGKDTGKREFVNRVIKATEEKVFVFTDEHSSRPHEQSFSNVIASGTDSKKSNETEVVKVDSIEYECQVVREELGNGFKTVTWWCGKAPGKIVK